MKVFWVIAAIILFLALLDRANRARTRRLRESGVYPPPGQGTDADVERLVVLGRKIDAIKLYREIRGVDLKTAKEAVEKLTLDLRRRGRTRGDGSRQA